MPAATPTYQLPYQVGTDPPCFGPGTGCATQESIWCDFVSRVDTQLTETDQVMGRTATTIPMAAIGIPVGTFVPMNTGLIGDYVPFTESVFDTDGIVTSYIPPFANASQRSVLVLSPQRDGIYSINLTVSCAETGVNSDLPFFGISVAGQTSIPEAVAVARTTGFPVTIRANFLYRFSASTGPFPRIVGAQSSVNFTETIIQGARLSIYWHSDL
jgi:hypothetical protein